MTPIQTRVHGLRFMASSISFNNAQGRIQRKLGILYYHAVVGTDDGLIYADNGDVWVRIWQSGGLSAPKAVRNKAQTVLQSGAAVRLSYDIDGRLIIESPDVDGTLAQGGNPYLNNSADQTFTGFTDQTQFATGLSYVISPDTTEIVVREWVFFDRGELRFVPGIRFDVSPYIPASGFQQLMGVFLKRDNTWEVAQSTAKSLADVITESDDLVECLNNRTPGSIPNSVWLFSDSQTTISNTDRWYDLRGILNIDDGTTPNDDPEVINTPYLIPSGRVKIMYNPTIGETGTLQVTGTLKLI